MKKLILISGLALGLLAGSNLYAAENVLRIGIEAAYPPFASKTTRAKSWASITRSAMPCARR